MVDQGMVIVGAGEAGVRAAFALREQGYQRSVTLIGEEPHLPYERPPLSKVSSHSDAGRAIVAEERFTGAGITFRRGLRVLQLKPSEHRLELEGGENLLYDRLLLATGATPRHLPGLPPNERIHVLRT